MPKNAATGKPGSRRVRTEAASKRQRPIHPAKFYSRTRCSTKAEVIQRVRAELGEHFENYVVLAKTRNPDVFYHAYDCPEWAAGAMSRMLGHMGD